MAQKKKPTASGEEIKSKLGDQTVLKSPLSVIKMDISELRDYTDRLNDYLRTPGIAALKICECCINVD
ncbi:hypothetical protein HPC49_45485 [Pyxidicoccus fallax]|uniref:Uncharacterized protein n=1 Tax=Pyxidicoccus fallax TaxID=394095 RepID=A0A848LJ94_9BACT|nr:hypothetical protein [Pyxidicoccus fallax]NMO17801.1 hypothetical protein [Pyxidicoccus fallax]NPC85435.1 hypothetical protein [Pyxidicoccus fallax]